MVLRYKQAVEKAIARLPAKNGVVDIDSIWVETSLPYDLLQEILTRDDLVLPEHVERINIKSRVRAGEQLGEPQRTRGRRRNKVRD
jgi:hypothetical protein